MNTGENILPLVTLLVFYQKRRTVALGGWLLSRPLLLLLNSLSTVLFVVLASLVSVLPSASESLARLDLTSTSSGVVKKSTFVRRLFLVLGLILSTVTLLTLVILLIGSLVGATTGTKSRQFTRLPILVPQL